MKRALRLAKGASIALALAAAFSLAAGACSADHDTCSELHDQLQKCGLQIAALECNSLELSAEQALLQRFKEKGCKAVTDSHDNAVDPRVCALAGWSCPAPPPPAPAESIARYPLVFVSGIDASPVFDWNPKIINDVNASGNAAYHVQVTPWSTTGVRGADLWASLVSLKARTGADKLNLLCYAVGGLDCRYVASPTGLFKGDAAGYRAVHNAIASVTTIATPHRGTRVADAALAAMQSEVAADILQTLVGAAAPPAVPDHAALVTTLDGLTLASLLAFNQDIGDGPDIYYQSWAGVSHVLGRSSASSDVAVNEHCVDARGAPSYARNPGTNDAMNPLLVVTAAFASTSLDDNGKVVTSPSDGMVSVESAKWGEFRGCMPADHYDVIGQIGHVARDGQTGFDAARFYRYVASDLAMKGF